MLENLYFMLDSLAMHADPFSDILKLANPRSLISGDFVAGGKWAIRFSPKGRIKFLAVTKGFCWLQIHGRKKAARFEVGDILLFSRDPVVLCSDVKQRPVDGDALPSSTTSGARRIGNGRDFALLGGAVQLDPASGEFLSELLPPALHIEASGPQASALPWLVAQIAKEKTANLPAASLASDHMAQLLFLHVLRVHLQSSGDHAATWLRASIDPRLRPAIQRMHDKPEHPWTLRELAQAARMSRATFALYFKTVSGITPFTYLTKWRMRLAGQALRNGDVAVSVLAQRCGYASESAFSNAFKRQLGLSPRHYRKAWLK
jgi:AraC-like DNA-binding protein